MQSEKEKAKQLKTKKLKLLIGTTLGLILVSSLLFASAPFISTSSAFPRTSLSYDFFGWDQVSNSWTKGNIAGYSEGDIANYVLVVSGSQGAALPINIEIEWDFFQAPKTSIPQGAVLADYLQNFYVGNSFNYKTASRNMSNQAGFTSFMPSAFGPETYPDTAESPSPQRNFNITAGFNGAPTEIGPSGIVVYYFEAHLSQSCIWLNDLESLFVPKTQISWISSGIPPRIGSSGFSGASPHFYLDVPGVGNKAIPIPIPPAPPGVITGHKWNDVIVNGEYETEDLPIEGWAITCSGIANGETVSFTAKTDSTGIYTFLLLPLGTWTITEASGIEGWLSSSPTSIEVVLPLPSGSPYGPADAFGAKNVDFFNYQPSSATTTLLSAETITLGESVYDTATVTTNSGTATGTLQFYFKVPNSESFEALGDPVSLDASGSAQSILYTPLVTGLYYFKAVYAGDGTYVGSESGDYEEPLVVGSADSTTTTLLSNLVTDESITIASLPDDSIVLGETVHDTVHVEGLVGYPAPTGTVQFYVQVPGGVFVELGDPVALDENGDAQSIVYTPNTAGLYYFKALYTGDANYVASASADTEEPLTVGPATPTVTTLLSSDSISLGDSVADTVNVAGLGGSFPVPSGTVDFQVMTPGELTWSTFSTNTLTDSSATSEPYTPAIAGSYFFRAVFTPDDNNYAESQSGETEEPLTVNSAVSTTTTLLSDDSIVLGETVHDTVHVEGLVGYPAPTGTVQFYVQVPGGVFVELGDPVALDENGDAQSIDYTPADVGTYYFKAVYFGDSSYVGSESGDTDEKLLVDEIGLTVSTTYLSSRKTVVFGITVFNQNFAPTLTGVTVAATGDYNNPEVISLTTLESGASTSATITQIFTPETHGTYTVTFTATGQDSNGYEVSADITVSVTY